MNRIQILSTLATATLIFACSGEDDRRSSLQQQRQQTTAQCNPACPTGLVCRAGVNGAPNDCVAATNNNGGNNNNNSNGGNNNGTTKAGFGGQCTGSESCQSGVCVDPPNAAGWCSMQCTGQGQGNCPSGYACAEASANVFVCLPAQNNGGGGGGTGRTLGEACARGEECASGLCLGDGAGSGYCTQDCQQAQCPNGYTCSQVEQYQVCTKSTGGGGGGGGTLTCSQLWDCVANCNQGDTACEQSCIDRATQSGYDKLVAVAGCFDRSGCTDQASCQQACGTEIQACIDD